MELFFREMGQGPEVVILHGLFGSSDNWQTFAKDLANLGYRVLSADLRNHGQSPHDPEFSYSLMAEDVAQLIERHCTGPVYMIGHSMGGKTVMKLASRHPERLLGFAVIDIAPRYYKPHHQLILAALRSFDPAALTSRGEAEKILADKIPDNGTRQFLLKNLYWKEKDKLAWRFNLDAIASNIEQVGEATPQSVPFNSPVLFVAGEKSDYITPDDRKDIAQQFESVQILTAPGAGHWVHAEQPAWLLSAITDHLRSI